MVGTWAIVDVSYGDVSLMDTDMKQGLFLIQKTGATL